MAAAAAVPAPVARRVEAFKRSVLKAAGPADCAANVRFGPTELRRNYAKFCVENLDGADLNRVCGALRGCGVYIKAPARAECATAVDVYVPLAPRAVSMWLVAGAAWAVCIACWLLGLWGRAGLGALPEL